MSTTKFQSRSETLVFQSHRQPLPQPWLAPCLASVESWAESQAFDYVFCDDEFFEIVPQWVFAKTRRQNIIATDIARLRWMQHFLASGYRRVVWLDADFLVFSPKQFRIPDAHECPEHYRLGREVWVQPAKVAPAGSRRYRAYIQVHNAFLLFVQGNHFLDFYLAHAERLLRKVDGPVPPQFLGPKLLTALHNVVGCPIQENAGVLSPWVLRDMLSGGGPALRLFQAKSSMLAAANLCGSLAQSEILSARAYEQIILKLLREGQIR